MAGMVVPMVANDEDPRIHMVQHLLLGMLGPLLLALSGPITLALKALSRDARRPLVALLHVRPLQLLVHPITA